MKISAYSFVDNNFKKGFYIFESISSALTFIDELVVLDGGSEDGTYEALLEMAKSEPKLKIYQLPWNQKNLMKHSCMVFKNAALMQCTGDWCILQDADEVIPEWDKDKIRNLANRTDVDSFEFNTLHFYKDFEHLNVNPDWYKHKIYMFKNFKGIHHGLWGIDNDLLVDFYGKPLQGPLTSVSVYHYGHVRPLEQYKWIKNTQHQRWHPGDEWKSYEINNWDMRFVQKFTGQHPKSMEKKINGL